MTISRYIAGNFPVWKITVICHNSGRFFSGWTNLPQNRVNVSHLTWIMSLHYLVKLEMLIAHVLQIALLQNLSHLNCALQIRQISVQLVTACGKYCKRYTTHASLICSYWRCHWRMAAAMTMWSSLIHFILSRCFSLSRSVMHVLYTFFCSIPTCCNQLDSILANSEARVEMG